VQLPRRACSVFDGVLIDVVALRAFEGSQIKSGLRRLDASEHHGSPALRAGLWPGLDCYVKRTCVDFTPCTHEACLLPSRPNSLSPVGEAVIRHHDAPRELFTGQHCSHCKRISASSGPSHRFPGILDNLVIQYAGKRRRFPCWRMSLSANRIPLRRTCASVDNRQTALAHGHRPILRRRGRPSWCRWRLEGCRPIFVETHASTETESRACWLGSACWWSFVSAPRRPAQPISLAGRAISSGRYPVRSNVFYGTSRGILSVCALWWF
jgi:hypothetical protein